MGSLPQRHAVTEVEQLWDVLSGKPQQHPVEADERLIPILRYRRPFDGGAGIGGVPQEGPLATVPIDPSVKRSLRFFDQVDAARTGGECAFLNRAALNSGRT